MNASSSLYSPSFQVSAVCRGLLKRSGFAAILLAMGLAGTAFSNARAQDSITLNDGSRREGAIVGVSGGNVRISIKSPNGTVESSVPLNGVKSVSMQPPSGFEEAERLLEQGNAAAGAAKLAPLVEKFLGLPAPWVQRAATMLVGAQLDSGDVAGAEKSLEAFMKAYPDAAELSPLLRARLAIGKNNFVGAKPLLTPIVAQGEQTKLADSQQSSLYGQAFYLMGQIREKEGDLPGDLQDYLRTTTIFFEDAAVTRKAQERVDYLSGEKNVVVP